MFFIKSFRTSKVINGTTIIKLCYILAAFHIALALAACFSRSVWSDEVSTLAKIKLSYTQIIGNITETDIAHVPLYFFITKTAVDVVRLALPNVPTITIVKIVTVVPMMLMLLLGATKVRRNWGGLCGAFFAFCITAMPKMLGFAIEIRMYSWGMLFITLAFLFAYDCATQPKALSWIFLCLSSTAACYTHYFTAVSAVMVYLVLFVWLYVNNRKALGRFLFSGLGVVVLFAPWLGVAVSAFSRASGMSTWMPPIGPRELAIFATMPFNFEGGVPGSLGDMISTMLVDDLIFCFLLVGFLYFSGKHGKPDKARAFFAVAGFAVLVGTTVVGCMLSWLVNPIFVARYMAQALPLVWLSLALLLTDLGRAQASVSNAIIAVLAVVATVVNLITFVPQEYTTAMNYNKFMPIMEQVTGDDIVLTDELHLVRVFRGLEEDLIIFGISGNAGQDPDMYLSYDDIAKDGGKRYFMLTDEKARSEFREFLYSRGLTAEYMGEHTFDRYTFEMHVLDLGAA